MLKMQIIIYINIKHSTCANIMKYFQYKSCFNNQALPEKMQQPKHLDKMIAVYYDHQHLATFVF